MTAPLFLVNSLSFLRVPLSLLLLIYVPEATQPQYQLQLPLVLLLVIYASDFIDGYLARRWRVTSQLGYLLDGFADRVSYYAIALLLFNHDLIAGWLCLLILVRDLALYTIRSYFPNWYKITSKDRAYSKTHAVLLKVVLGALLVSLYLEYLPNTYNSEVTVIRPVLNISLVVLMIISYWLLFQQTKLYYLRDGANYGCLGRE